jgi:hypothetical protein
MKTIFPNLFKKRYKYRVILKSGADFRLTATDLKLEWRNEDCVLTFYSFIDPKGEVPRHVSPLDIQAITKIV